MGRTEKSQGLAPPAIRRDIRAKQARHIVNKVIPAILSSNARAKRGSEESELISDPPPTKPGTKHLADIQAAPEEPTYIKRKGQGRRKAKNSDELLTKATHEHDKPAKTSTKNKNFTAKETPRLDVLPPAPLDPSQTRTIRILATDTLTATQKLLQESRPSRKDANICILNMASPLRPGGGVLTGAQSQEEFLCARTTLLPSLKEGFYRLPEYGGVYTRDVLVFRNALPITAAAGELGAAERFYVDVISAGMLRFPELEGTEEEERTLSGKDRAVVERKMRAVLRMACSRGVRRLVLGAWGCGAYGNPTRDVAEAWNRVINSSGAGGKRGEKAEPVEHWSPITEIVFAISSAKMASVFSGAFSPAVEVEMSSGDDDEEEVDEEPDEVAEELRTKIKEMEDQLGSVWNPDLKQRMGVILDSLKEQLHDREGRHEDKDSVLTDDEEGESEGDITPDLEEDVGDSDNGGLEL